jgi:hypothetical protein
LSSDTPSLADTPPQADTPRQADPQSGADVLPHQSGLSVLTKKNWWRNAFSFCVCFAPKCIKPASIFLALVFVMLGLVVVESLLLQQTAQQPNLIMLPIVFFLNLFALVISCFLICWGFAVWLGRLTAFAAAFNHTPQSQFLSEKIDIAASKLVQLTSIQESEKRKVFLAKYWSGISLFLTLPTIIFIVPFSITVYAAYIAHAPAGATSTMLPAVSAPVNMICSIVSLVFGTYIMVISLAGIVISATTQLQPRDAVIETIKISHLKIVPLSLITLVMLSVSFVISAPREVVQHFVSIPFAENNPFFMFGDEIWRAITSVILLTFSLAPICEYLRSKPQ